MDERVVLGIEQLETTVQELAQFVAELSVGVLPSPDAIAKTRYDITCMVAALTGLRKLVEREVKPFGQNKLRHNLNAGPRQ